MLNWLKPKPSIEPKTLGQIGEELTRLEYQKRGYQIIAANFFNKKGLRLGEIDFIAKDSKKIIFVEVKTRTSNKGRFGTAQESVNQFKQVKLLKAVKIFLLRNPEFAVLAPQIDVAVVLIKNFSNLAMVSDSPAKYQVSGELDNILRYVTIIPNAVEDWN